MADFSGVTIKDGQAYITDYNGIVWKAIKLDYVPITTYNYVYHTYLYLLYRETAKYESNRTLVESKLCVSQVKVENTDYPDDTYDTRVSVYCDLISGSTEYGLTYYMFTNSANYPIYGTNRFEVKDGSNTYEGCRAFFYTVSTYVDDIEDVTSYVDYQYGFNLEVVNTDNYRVVYTNEITGTKSVEVPPLNKASSFTAPSETTVGMGINITILPYRSTYTHTLTYKIEDEFGQTYMSGTLAEQSSETKFVWVPPESLYQGLPNLSVFNLYVYCYTYNNGVQVGERTFKQIDIRTSAYLCSPTITVSAEDTNIETLYLTGDKNKVIKFFSDVKVTADIDARMYATIKNVTYTGATGEKVINTSIAADGVTTATVSNTFKDVEGVTFSVAAQNSRGYVTTKSTTLSLIDYFKLSANLECERPTGAGDCTFTITGNFFEGNFGVHDNSLTVLYRYKSEEDEDYGEWFTMPEAYIYNGVYTTSTTVSGLNYKLAYTFQARAFDMLMTIDSSPVVTQAIPLFTWGKEDFNFYVPVNFKAGINFDGNTASILGACRALTNTYSLDTTTTSYNGWTTNGSAILMGGNLRCYISASNPNATGSGNIANTLIGTLKIKHDGKIKSAYRINFSNGATGGLASFQTYNEDNDGTYLTLGIQIMAADLATTEISTYFIVPCSLNLDKFEE